MIKALFYDQPIREHLHFLTKGKKGANRIQNICRSAILFQMAGLYPNYSKAPFYNHFARKPSREQLVCVGPIKLYTDNLEKCSADTREGRDSVTLYRMHLLCTTLWTPPQLLCLVVLVEDVKPAWDDDFFCQDYPGKMSKYTGIHLLDIFLRQIILSSS